LGAGQAAFSLPDRERSLERFTRLVDPPCALEDGAEVFVRERLPLDVVRLCFRGGDCRARPRLRQLELTSLRERIAQDLERQSAVHLGDDWAQWLGGEWRPLVGSFVCASVRECRSTT